MSLSSAELVIVPPADEPAIASEFAARCVIGGVHFWFDRNDTLPMTVPAGLRHLKAVVIDESACQANAEVLDQYESADVAVYVMSRSNNPAIPNMTLAWTGEKTFHSICFDADLQLDHPDFYSSRAARLEQVLFQQLAQRIFQSENASWHDATRYQWEAMLAAHRMTGNTEYLARAIGQMEHAVHHVPNDLRNCDCVAPLIPLLQVYELTGDRKLLAYAQQKFDRYLEITPLFEGCLVNFDVYRRQVRSEVLWQVLPGMVLLGRIANRSDYIDRAMEQFTRLHRLLYDPEERLWNHGRNRTHCTPGGFWARSVAYSFYANVLLVESITQSHPAWQVSSDTLRQTAQRLADLQDDAGYWYAVVTKPDSQRESSGTAWLCAAMHRAIRGGLINEAYQPVADRAWNAVKARIWQGDYPGHMTATTVSPSAEYYSKKMLLHTGWSHFALCAMSERYAAGWPR